ncbi:hypothetical protein I2492_09435 [Budviciaceae bacterium CWB-B4]|uniref:Uncharacterized protein n=2 Tax=Limnobaculum xujianqingii TaxID=2738837 RepID=A0A9D7AI41_9GAMM|nr:hypothetical protein [Limnobaculum xujianqingii]MBK5176546.1 hypothetical protein [Limnobaculum xujianqingii]
MSRRQLANYMVTEYIAAELAILTGAQSYSIAGKSLTRANLNDITKMRQYWERRVAAFNGRGGRVVKTVHIRD